MADLLAAATDLPTWLGYTDVTTVSDRTQLALEVATGWVQGYTGQRLVAVANEAAKIRNRRQVQELFLPERPVTSVTSVTVEGVVYSAATDWTLYGDSLLTSSGKGRWSFWPEFMTVTYSHGYASAPQDIRGVVLSAAARIVGNPGGNTSWTVGGVSYAGGGSAGGFTPDEQSTLDRYRKLVVA